MFIAAMLDALPDLRARVLADATAVLPAAVGEPLLEEVMNGGVRALHFRLKATEGGGSSRRVDDGRHRALVTRIDTVALSPGTAEAAKTLLGILADAEAAIHGVPVDEVHFHEIADWDSLLDMVAAGSIAAALDGARWTVSPLPRGGGLVRTAHGLLPVPSPAAAAILEGFQWRDDGIDGERVTPTGAAILRHLVPPVGPAAEGRLKAAGTGAGTRSLPGIPNILRVLVFDQASAASGERVVVVSFEVDDMTGEEIGVACDRLRLVAGVLDVSIAARWGKKGRPMQSFQIVARTEAADDVVARCFEETATIGLRVREESRVVLKRQTSDQDGIDVKTVSRPVTGQTRKAESDDLQAEGLAARRAMKQRAERGPE
ncbi:MAG: LarC family nickel insertion protein [Hyphomicrobiales bacterium]|nr:LarC family nickel insertion protein [Hyphomicrobiales bacterium]